MSANSGSEIYNVALITGTSPSGARFAMARGHTDTDTTLAPASTVTVPNPGFESNTTGWNVLWGSLARDTTVAQASTASGRMTTDATALEAQVRTQLTGFRPGLRYRITIGVNKTAALSYGPNLQVELDNNIMQSQTSLAGDFAVGTWTNLSISFVAQHPSHWFRVRADSATANQVVLYIDNVQVERTNATVVDRRGFVRSMQLPVSSALPDVTQPDDLTAQAKIADVWLAQHKTTPFRGSLTLVGDESLREITTGRNVGLEELLLNTGQLLRFSDRLDPDTGGHGRDGRIVGVTYYPATNTAQVTVDNSRTSIEALLARLAVIQGG